jgi:hypothetical protein
LEEGLKERRDRALGVQAEEPDARHLGLLPREPWQIAADEQAEPGQDQPTPHELTATGSHRLGTGHGR